MAPRATRLSPCQRRILGVLLQHHQAAGWETPLARGELLARLHGWGYGRQLGFRGRDAEVAVPVAYTGLAARPAGYDAAQAELTRALRRLYGLGLVRVAGSRAARLGGAAELIAEMEADLREPEAAYARCRTAGLPWSYDEFLARRRDTLAAWRAGRGRPVGSVQLVALSAAGRAEAERPGGDFVKSLPAPRT